jgi:hypothetical protein
LLQEQTQVGGVSEEEEMAGSALCGGLQIKILHEGDRSVGFIEYIPGEYA